jgi:hypothetical protein
VIKPACLAQRRQGNVLRPGPGAACIARRQQCRGRGRGRAAACLSLACGRLAGTIGSVIFRQVVDDDFLLVLGDPGGAELVEHIVHDPAPGLAVQALRTGQLEAVAGPAVGLEQLRRTGNADRPGALLVFRGEFAGAGQQRRRQGGRCRGSLAVVSINGG